MKQVEIKNAIIKAATLGTGDRGFLQCWLDLDYGDGSGQGFGGFCLHLPKGFKNHELLSVAGHYIHRVMEVAEVDDWSKLKGRTIRVHIEDGRIEGIGHIVKNDWFIPLKDFEGVVTKGRYNAA